uniref:Solute carrier family 35 member F3 n=1 Tax=Macaca fascicularis TaxID=9541 RepID=A0A7N9DAF4_MACFA
ATRRPEPGGQPGRPGLRGANRWCSPAAEGRVGHGPGEARSSRPQDVGDRRHRSCRRPAHHEEALGPGGPAQRLQQSGPDPHQSGRGGAPPGLPGPGGGPGAGRGGDRRESEPPLLDVLPGAAQEDLLGRGGRAVRVLFVGGLHAARQADLQEVRRALHPHVVCHQLELFILPVVLRGARLQVHREAVCEAEIQIVAAILAIAGIVMMTYADGFHSHSVIGIALVVASASMSALYKVLFKLLLGSAKFGEAALFLSILGVFNILFITCIPIILYFTKVEYWSSFDDIPWGNLCGFSVLLLTFNIVLNFGIAVTYPTLMSLGIVLSVPVNAVIDHYTSQIVFNGVRVIAIIIIGLGFLLLLLPEEWDVWLIKLLTRLKVRKKEEPAEGAADLSSGPQSKNRRARPSFAR